MAFTFPKNLRSALVAERIGTTPKTIENWLQRAQIALPSGPVPPGKWRDFTAADVCYLALVVQLTKMGVPVGIAGEMATFVATSSHAAPNAGIANREDSTPSRENRRLLIWREGEQWFRRMDQEDTGTQPPAPAFLVVLVDDVQRTAIKHIVAADAKSEAWDASFTALGASLDELTDTILLQLKR